MIRNKKRRKRERNKRIVFASFVSFVTVFFIGYFLLINAQEEPPEEPEKEEDATEEIAHSAPMDELDMDVAAALSVHWDGEKERVLYEKNPDTALPIASISKIMTALVVKKNYDLDQEIGIREEDVIFRSGFEDFRAWSGTSIEEMLYPMLIESNNSSAPALATVSGRFLDVENDPVDRFVKEMNRKAEDIGLHNTEFINPSGLDEKNGANQSTARNVVKLAQHTLSETDIFDILSHPSYRLYSPSGNLYYTSINTNEFLLDGREKGWRERIVGGKTGRTHRALECLLMVVESPSGEGYLINVVLGTDDRFGEMEKLLDFVHDTYDL